MRTADKQIKNTTAVLGLFQTGEAWEWKCINKLDTKHIAPKMLHKYKLQYSLKEDVDDVVILCARWSEEGGSGTGL